VRVCIRVVGEHFHHKLQRHNIEHGDHLRRLLSEPDGKSWHFVGEISKVDLERLLVILAHFLDAVRVSRRVILLVAELSHEVIE